MPEGQRVWHDAESFSKQERLVVPWFDDVHPYLLRRYRVDGHRHTKLLPLFLYECGDFLKCRLSRRSKRDAEGFVSGLRETDLVQLCARSGSNFSVSFGEAGGSQDFLSVLFLESDDRLFRRRSEYAVYRSLGVDSGLIGKALLQEPHFLILTSSPEIGAEFTRCFLRLVELTVEFPESRLLEKGFCGRLV